MNTPTVLVTGATGDIGSSLVPALHARGAHVRAMSRTPGRTIAGAPRVVADLRDAASLTAALDGVDTLFLNSPSDADAAELQIRFADLARRAGVERLVLLSQYAARAGSPVRFLRWHAAVEEHVAALDLGVTVLRPNLYLQGVLAFADSIAHEGRFGAPIGDAAVSAVDTRDIAEVAAAVLTGPGHSGRTYTLTGPEAVTHQDIAAALSAETGYPISFADVPESAFADLLGPLLGPWQAEGLVEDYAHYRRGEAAEIDPAVPTLLGRPARGLADFARDYAAAFAPAASDVDAAQAGLTP